MRYKNSEEATRGMLGNSDLMTNDWPQWPFLPVKRSGVNSDPFGELGVIMSGRITTVFITNLFSLPRTEEGWAALKQYQYPTVQALMNDGWRVD